jgi:hypothetical protein
MRPIPSFFVGTHSVTTRLPARALRWKEGVPHYIFKHSSLFFSAIDRMTVYAGPEEYGIASEEFKLAMNLSCRSTDRCGVDYRTLVLKAGRWEKSMGWIVARTALVAIISLSRSRSCRFCCPSFLNFRLRMSDRDNR